MTRLRRAGVFNFHASVAIKVRVKKNHTQGRDLTKLFFISIIPPIKFYGGTIRPLRLALDTDTLLERAVSNVSSALRSQKYAVPDHQYIQPQIFTELDYLHE